MTIRVRNKSISELTDGELEEELRARRRARGGRGGAEGEGRGESRGVGAEWSRKAVERADRARVVARYYANLELEPGASREDIDAAYKRLMAKYDPSKHAGDPAKHEAATELTRSLTRAYEALIRHFEK